MIAMGIDVTAGRRPLTLCILNDHRQVIHYGEGDHDWIVQQVLAHDSAFCAVDAPASGNAGLMADPAYRASLGLAPSDSRYIEYKTSEYELMRRGIKLYNTPRTPDRIPAWMLSGFRLYAALHAAGYVDYQQQGSRVCFEVHPHACYTVLIGRIPASKSLAAGLVERAMLLDSLGIDRAAMPITHDMLDAAIAAYTAWLAAHHPTQVHGVGDPSEGQIILPIPPGRLRVRYRRKIDY